MPSHPPPNSPPLSQSSPSYYKALINAYKVRSSFQTSVMGLSKANFENNDEPQSTDSNIYVLKPVKIQPKSLTNPGVSGRFLLGGNTLTEKKRHRKDLLLRRKTTDDLNSWPHREPTLSGVDQTLHQSYLSDTTSFTGVHKSKVLDDTGGGGRSVSGDYASTPRRVTVLLKSLSYSELNGGKMNTSTNLQQGQDVGFCENTGGREGDFRNEVLWRSGLRPPSSSSSSHEVGMVEYRVKAKAKGRLGRKTYTKNDSISSLLNYSPSMTSNDRLSDNTIHSKHGTLLNGGVSSYDKIGSGLPQGFGLGPRGFHLAGEKPRIRTSEGWRHGNLNYAR